MTVDNRPSLRVWPGIVIVLLQWAVTLGSGIWPGTPLQFFGMMGGPGVGLLLLLIWWLAASRARWSERLIGLGLLLGSLAATFALVHDSMGLAMFLWGIPVVCAAFVLAVASFRDAGASTRRWATAGLVLAACAVFLLLRAEGVRGDMNIDFALRFSPTPEERLAKMEPAAGDAAAGLDATALTEAPWPAFRGPRRDGTVPGVRIVSDWDAHPPAELWRRPVGPGWGSFSVAEGRLYTQEQRGDDEIVACYDAATGKPIWVHRDRVRFWEAMAGAGPRATPSLHEGRVYALGATGILNALDAADGSRIWTRDIAADTGAETPNWGFASSPLIVGDLVVVHTGAPDGKALVAYDGTTGEPRWFAGVPGASYSSAHLVTLQGTNQIVILTGAGAAGLAPETGELLWEHAWSLDGARIVQPAFTPEGDLLIGTGLGMGVQRVGLTRDAAGWTTETRWTSTGLKPYFNDFVTHEGHAYGFDGRIMSSIDLSDGSRNWKGGRYGHGQALLLPDQDLIIVLSETGDLALVEATPEAFVELARIPAIEGKTWNHPVLVDGTLYVRNGEEMAAFRVAG